MIATGIVNIIKEKGMRTEYADHLTGSKLAFVEELRKRIQELHPLIIEKPTVKTINYQINKRNFAAIQPQGSKVVVAPLHLSFNSIKDPKKICRDISGVTYGLSNKSRPDEVRMDFQGENLKDAAYAIPLIKKSLAKILLEVGL